jgi:tetratricopeptide (TPR) repeat protein
MESQRYPEALTEIDQIIDWQPADVEAYLLRAEIHQYLGEHQEAVNDWKQILSFDSVAATAGRAEGLNGLAYARSLANVEIDEGLVNVDEAMQLAGENYARLDTRGFLYYRKGDLERAIGDLNNAVEFAEAGFKDAVIGSSDPRVRKQILTLLKKNLAVIRYHRALIHDARGDREKADADRRRVRELGFEPSENLF